MAVGQLAEQFGRELAKARLDDARRYLGEAERAYRQAQNVEKAEEVQKALAELGGALAPPPAP
jgi:hypothetical protein